MNPQCPCCERPMEIEPHEPGEGWTPGQLALMRQLNGKVKREVIGAIWGVSGDTITAALRAERNGKQRALMVSRQRVNPRTLLHRQKVAEQEAAPAKHQVTLRRCLRCQRHFESQWIGNRLCPHCGGTGAKTAKVEEAA